ncbi:MAG: YbaN family protein [Reichenbachiella sp.]
MKLAKPLFFTLGCVTLVLAILGIVLPLLPTTPFLLLSAACFMRSSDTMYQWLTHHKHFGPLISNYMKYRAVTLKTKVIAITTLWIFIMFSVILFGYSIWVKALLLAIALGVSLYIHSLKVLVLSKGDDK